MEMNYILHYEIAALLIVIPVALHFFLKKTINTRLVRIFSIMIISALIANVFNLITVAVGIFSDIVPVPVMTVCIQIYLIAVNLIPVAYYAYILCVTQKEKRLSKLELCRIFIPISVLLLLILFTPLNGWIFCYNKDGVYHNYQVI